MDKLGIPIAVSQDGLVGVISAWFRAKAHESALSVADAAKKSGVNRQTMQRQLPFLTQVGILREEDGAYRLTDSGERLATYAQYSQIGEFNEVMQQLMLGWKELQPLLDFINESTDLTYGTLVKRIMMYSQRSPSDRNVSMGAGTLADLMKSVGMIEVKDFYVTLTQGITERRGLQEPSETKTTETTQPTEPLETPSKESTAPVRMTEVVIRNIRSIAEVRIPLKRMNIFVGKNASGKSSILYALLALRNLKWDRDFAPTAYHDLRLLQRKGCTAPMFVRVSGVAEAASDSTVFRLNVGFAPSKSYATQLCVYDGEQRLCDLSIQAKGSESVVSVDSLEGLQGLKKISKDLGEAFVQLQRALGELVDLSDEKTSSTGTQSEIAWSFMEDSSGQSEHSEKPRRFLGSWQGVLPKFLTDENKRTISRKYRLVRPALSSYIDNTEFVPVVRASFSIDYSQRDTPVARLSDSQDFTDEILSRLVYEDYVDRSALEHIRDWASRFGIANFEGVTQPRNRTQARGRSMGKDSFPIALHGFGANQFLSVIWKCVFSSKGAPILIEEPEIHLHPELQALAADFLIETMKEGHQLFITTHSEHLIGRFQRRIAEGEVSADDIAILWVKRDSDAVGTVVEEVTIDEEGILHEGLLTYLGFMQEEIKATEHARDKKKAKGG